MAQENWREGGRVGVVIAKIGFDRDWGVFAQGLGQNKTKLEKRGGLCYNYIVKFS